jgi:hypothetical protein
VELHGNVVTRTGARSGEKFRTTVVKFGNTAVSACHGGFHDCRVQRSVPVRAPAAKRIVIAGIQR